VKKHDDFIEMAKRFGKITDDAYEAYDFFQKPDVPLTSISMHDTYAVGEILDDRSDDSSEDYHKDKDDLDAIFKRVKENLIKAGIDEDPRLIVGKIFS
jgi:hypothetical protein